MSAEDIKNLQVFLSSKKTREGIEVVELYETYFSHGVRDGSVFVFIGPGIGAEVYAMVAYCQRQGVKDFAIVQVDRPNSIQARLLGGLPPFTTLIADYIKETSRVLDFFKQYNVNRVIVRNAQTTHSTSALTSFAKYAKEAQGNCLITIRDEDYSHELEKNLIALGMRKQKRPSNFSSLTEKYIYTL